MGWQDLIAVAIVAVAVVYAGRSLWQTLGGRTPCGGSCNGSTNETTSSPSRQLKRLPLVEVDQLGRPPVE